MTRLVNTGQHGGNGDRVIHTNPKCGYVTDDSLPAKDAPVDADKLDTCSWCDGESGGSQDHSKSCSYCGERIISYARHLPCEESP